VTHDQEEAMTISDRIAVMNAGRIEQIGTPREIYDRPTTRFVADFIGEINLLEGEWHDGGFIIDGKVLPAPTTAQTGKATMAIRPERMHLTQNVETALKGRVRTSTFVSGQMIYHITLENGRELTVKEANTGLSRPIGTQVGVDWDPNDVVILNE
jgi:ABC-type Fe3+/spermidine/putrescine transport system ATPase subunit